MVKSNGGVIGVRNSANGSSGTNLATGMWGLPEHGLYVKEGSWPKNKYTIDYLIVAGGGGAGSSQYSVVP